VLEGDPAAAIAAVHAAWEDCQSQSTRVQGRQFREQVLAKVPTSIHPFAAARLAAPRYDSAEDAKLVLLDNLSKLHRLQVVPRGRRVVAELRRLSALGDVAQEDALLLAHQNRLVGELERVLSKRENHTPVKSSGGPKKSDRLSTKKNNPASAKKAAPSKPSARAAPKPAASARPPRGSPRAERQSQGGQWQDQSRSAQGRGGQGEEAAKVERVESEPKERPKDHAREAKEPKESPQGRRSRRFADQWSGQARAEQGRERSERAERAAERGEKLAEKSERLADRSERERADRERPTATRGTRATRATRGAMSTTDHAGEEQGVFDLRRRP